MRIKVKHTTTYRYDEPPRRMVQLLRLTPDNYEGQTVNDWLIDLNCDADLVRSRDAYGNITHLMTVESPPEQVEIMATGDVDTLETHGVVSGLNEPLPPLVYCRPTDLSKVNEKILAFAQEVAGDKHGLEAVHALNVALHEHVTFQTGITDAYTTAAQAFDRGAGVCQDLSHLYCAMARALGYPARYVSGHLLRQDGENDQPAAHAWAEAHVENLGWVAFDPAHGISADEHYVRIAAGADYRSAAPIVGTRFGGGTEFLSVTTSTRGSRLKQSQSQTSGGSSQSQSQNQ